MKMLTNEMDAETDKWNGESDENNDIVKRAKNMSSMAFSMYQFTKGEGTLRTTQDLFTQAEYFAEEANRLYKVVRQFSYQVCVFLDFFSHSHDQIMSQFYLVISHVSDKHLRQKMLTFISLLRCQLVTRKKIYWII